MDHNQAVHLRAADRYLLGELTGEERERFEEHYFSCLECADEVRAGELLRANAAAVLGSRSRERAEARGWLEWLRWRPALAGSWALAGVFLAVTLYQSLVLLPGLRDRISELSGPQAVERYALRALSRGEDLTVAVPSGSRFIQMAVHLGPEHRFAAYSGELLDAAGARLLAVPSPAPRQPGLPLEFLIPAEKLPEGACKMVIRGFENQARSGPGTEVGTYVFVVRRN